MFLNSILFLFTIFFSFILFFINNLYIIIGIFLLLLFISIIFKVRLPLYKSFIILLIINFVVNMLLSDYIDALMVTLRLIIMFMLVNIVIKKIGVFNLGKIIGYILHSDSIGLIISISLSFVPLMIKELGYIKSSLKSKNFNLNLINIIKKPSVFVTTFFNNLFKRVDDMEKVLLSKGYEE